MSLTITPLKDYSVYHRKSLQYKKQQQLLSQQQQKQYNVHATMYNIKAESSQHNDYNKHKITVLDDDTTVIKEQLLDIIKTDIPSIKHTNTRQHQHTTTTTIISPTTSASLFSCSHKRQSHWNVQCCCLFSYLPDELMLFNVFTLLTQRELCIISQTCKRWNFLANDRLLWQNIDLSKYNKKVNDQTLNYLLRRYVHYTY